jgi:hypothetical protein
MLLSHSDLVRLWLLVPNREAFGCGRLKEGKRIAEGKRNAKGREREVLDETPIKPK